jgi:uncharacterized protein (TIGR02598 family)
MKTTLSRFHRHSLHGFTLVELVLAIGVVSFSLLAVVGSLPVGLESVQEAMVQAAKANISRELRGELQQISFKSGGDASTVRIDSLDNVKYFYTREGMMVSGSTSSNAYYEATFAVGDGSYSKQDGDFTFQSVNARNITVVLSYPLQAPAANRKQTTFSLFAAKQKSN